MLNPLTRKADDTPGGLASELAAARQTYEAVRAEVIDRGVARQQAVSAMIEELRNEEAALENVIQDAEDA